MECHNIILWDMEMDKVAFKKQIDLAKVSLQNLSDIYPDLTVEVFFNYKTNSFNLYKLSSNNDLELKDHIDLIIDDLNFQAEKIVAKEK